MQKARRRPLGLRPLVNERFQVLFHSPVRGASHLSLTVLVHYRSSGWFTIGLPDVFSLAAWSPLIQTGFHVSRLTQVVISFEPVLPVRGCHPLRPHFPVRSSSTLELHDNSYNPAGAVTSTVWALPLSLATTQGIDLSFSSWGY